MSRVAHRLADGQTRTKDVVNDDNVNVDFASLLLKPVVQAGLANAGFERPSPIQLKAIPLGRCGLDLIVQAKSGTGKTCVFSVIALEGLDLQSNSTQVLVLAPTREIAVQIQEVIHSIGSAMDGLRCHVFIGGTMVGPDKQNLKKCHIAVGTPGRIKQLIEFELLKTESIRLFVLDEADKLLDHKFSEQVNWIYHRLTENKQMLALSATYPEYLAQQLTTYMRDPMFVRLNRKDLALHGIKQYFKVVPGHRLSNKAFEVKVTHLIEILSQVAFTQCLVFSNLQSRAQNLSDMLNFKGWPSTYISGHQEQAHRLSAMAMLKKFQCRILISTDLTARGIDAENVNLIINLDVPFDIKTYFHRIGRAGRFGTQGAAITLASTGQEEIHLANIKKHCHGKMTTLPEPLPADLLTHPQVPEDISNSQSASSESESDSLGDLDQSESLTHDVKPQSERGSQSMRRQDCNQEMSPDVQTRVEATGVLDSQTKHVDCPVNGVDDDDNAASQARKAPRLASRNQVPGIDKGCQIKPSILSGIFGIDTLDFKITPLSQKRTVNERWTYEKAKKDFEIFLDPSKAPPPEDSTSQEIKVLEPCSYNDDEPDLETLGQVNADFQESAQKELGPQEELPTEPQEKAEDINVTEPDTLVSESKLNDETTSDCEEKQAACFSSDVAVKFDCASFPDKSVTAEEKLAGADKQDEIGISYGKHDQAQDIVTKTKTLPSNDAGVLIQPVSNGQILTPDVDKLDSATSQSVTQRRPNTNGKQLHHTKRIASNRAGLRHFSIGQTLHHIEKKSASNISDNLKLEKSLSGGKDPVWEMYRQYLPKSEEVEEVQSNSTSSSSAGSSDTESSSCSDLTDATQETSSETDSESDSDNEKDDEESESDSDEEEVSEEIMDAQQHSYANRDYDYERHMCSGVQDMSFEQHSNTDGQSWYGHWNGEPSARWQAAGEGHYQYPYWYMSAEYAPYAYSGYYNQWPNQQSFPWYNPH